MKKIFACMLCCLILAGCGKSVVEATGPAKAPVMTVPATEAPAVTAPPETTGTQEHFITLYAPNEDATGFIYASWEVPEISAETICGALIEAGVLNEDVAFNRLILENGQINLDVNAAFQTQLMSYGTAGEYMMIGSVVNTLLRYYNAETVYITMEGEILESGHMVYDFPLELYEDHTTQPLNDLPPMVMVDGKLYIDTGKESTVTARCGMMDGIIESMVDSWQAPTQDNQSNFGIGFGYQYGPEPGTIEVNIDGDWYVYATEEELTDLSN